MSIHKRCLHNRKEFNFSFLLQRFPITWQYSACIFNCCCKHLALNSITNIKILILYSKVDWFKDPRLCLVRTKIENLVEIGTIWWKSWKFVYVGNFWCDGKVGSLKKNFVTKHGPNVTYIFNTGKIFSLSKETRLYNHVFSTYQN